MNLLDLEAFATTSQELIVIVDGLEDPICRLYTGGCCPGGRTFIHYGTEALDIELSRKRDETKTIIIFLS